MKKVVVVGAGVAGLTAGYLLAQKGYHVVVLEKEDRVGGLARSFYYDGFIFDIGPHRFHTDDEKVLEFIENILGENKIVLPRKSGVWMFGKYHDWPLNWKVLFKLPVPVILRTAFDIFSKKTQKGDSFEDYIMERYGKTLYDVFFKPYTEKFLKLSPEKVHRHWAETGIDRAIIDKKVSMGSLTEVIKTALIPRAVQTNFLYPSDGGIEKSGGKVLLNSPVKRIESEGSKIAGVYYREECIQPDLVIWTAPITTLVSLLQLPSCDINYISMVVFNIEVKGMPRTTYQWCYFGQSDTTMNRVSIPALFSDQAAPQGKTGICVEVTCFERDDVWKNPERLIDTILSDLFKVKMIKSREDIEKIHVEKILNTYPVYDIEYTGKLKKILALLEEFEGIKLLGRTGTFWYNNMDHSIRMAFDLANKILNA